MRVYISIFFIFWGASSISGQSTLAKAQGLTAQQAYESSSALLLDYIENHPQRKYDVARAWWLHSNNLLKTGLLQEAEQANTTSLELRKALRSNDAAYNFLRAADINIANSNYEMALDYALQGMQLMIEDATLYASLNMACARALIPLDHNDEAQKYMQTALDIIDIELSKKHPSYSEYAFNAGFLSIRAKAFEQAHQYFQKAYIYSHDAVLRTKAYFFAIANY